MTKSEPALSGICEAGRFLARGHYYLPGDLCCNNSAFHSADESWSRPRRALFAPPRSGDRSASDMRWSRAVWYPVFLKSWYCTFYVLYVQQCAIRSPSTHLIMYSTALRRGTFYFPCGTSGCKATMPANSVTIIFGVKFSRPVRQPITAPPEDHPSGHASQSARTHARV